MELTPGLPGTMRGGPRGRATIARDASMLGDGPVVTALGALTGTLAAVDPTRDASGPVSACNGPTPSRLPDPAAPVPAAPIPTVPASLTGGWAVDSAVGGASVFCNVLEKKTGFNDL